MSKKSLLLAGKIRKHAVEMVHHARASHIGAALSVTDIVAVLYAEILHVDCTNPQAPNRDRFILSKGHAGIAVYAALAESGFFDVSCLASYGSNGTSLSGHISHKGVTGVEFSTGSLGHGLSIGAGMALAAKLDGRSNHVYVVVGDGECNEGAVWEAALFAAHHKLSNLTVIVDHNKIQGMGFCDDILSLRPLGQKWASFGWDVIDIDGHDHMVLESTFRSRNTKDSPQCVIAHTAKGKGVSFMENELLWHYRDPQDEYYTRAMAEIDARHNSECAQ